ncbi:MAG TPA: glycosyl hydrolase family 18 protein, partial [Actinomycetota bacterium]|nr:glycosyl hydrolase family 18 protein [Actinomycetota bacterium]
MRRRALGLAAVALTLLATPAQAQQVVIGWTGDATIPDPLPVGPNVVSPSWWHLTSTGGVSGSGDRAGADRARARGVRVWPLFANGNDPERSRLVMRDPARRREVIDRIGDLAAANGADGVNIDWENLHTEDKDAFSTFVAEAASAWRSRGLVVSVDVTPLTDTWSLGNWSEAYDRAALGRVADLVVLMAYDQHNRLRPHGPTASLPWVRDAVRALVREVDPSKVVLGMPFYTYEWTDPARPKAITLRETDRFLARTSASVRWDPELGLAVATYGGDRTVWLEDDRSLSLKAALVGGFGLAGVAAWRIGFDTPGAWEAAMGRIAAPTPPATPVPS